MRYGCMREEGRKDKIVPDRNFGMLTVISDTM